MTTTRLTGWQHVAVIAVFLLLVSLFTYPLILDPGGLLPTHKDPFMYGWTMVSNVHRLLTAPLAVFHGNTFYPHGNSIAFTDLLLTPMLTGAPVYLLTGNPVLPYNLTLLSWWALSGWAMYVMTFGLLRSHLGATIAAVVFTLCPYRTDYFHEFEMQLAFPIPLALFFFFRFLETHRWCDLAGVVLLVWVGALAAMYYAIMLGFCLVVVAALHATLRSGSWNWTVIRRSLWGALLLGLLLGPFVVPYVQNYRELGLHRELRQPARHSADILTYFETGVTKLYQFRPSGHVAETSLFMGFVALTLAAGACVSGWGNRAPSTEQPPIRRSLPPLLTGGIVAAVLGLTVSLVWGDALRAAGLPPPKPQRFFNAILLLGLARIGFEGWWAARAGAHRGPLGERELRWIFLFLLALFFVLSLGPWIRYGRTELGTGLYYYLYQYFFPLRAMRITTRFGVIVVLAIGLLAGLGMKHLAARLPGVRWRVAATGVLAVLILAEYASFPLSYQGVNWSERPPVYGVLAQDTEDVAVLEWPLGIEYWDDYYTFMSISHWKRLVNGASGFRPGMTRDISVALSVPHSPETPFPSPAARYFLQGIHPLRYVVVHNERISPDDRRKWQRLTEVPWARYVGRFGHDDLYQLIGDVEGAKIEKIFSWDYAWGRREIAFQVRSVGPAERERWIEVDLNGRRLGRQDVGDRWASVVMPIARPLHYSAPNVVTIRLRYQQGREGPARPIGTTGVLSPADLHIASGGARQGNTVSVLVDGIEFARQKRGYNVVAIAPQDGRVLWTDHFDTHASVDEAQRLAEVVGQLPQGTIVVAAVQDEASAALTDEAVAALQSLGGEQDIRRRYRISHLLIGSKGAPRGTAIERSGYALLAATLGLPPDQIGVEVRDFALR
jgi:Interleukin-like EMT inducer